LGDKYVHNSTYAFAENRVINGIDLEGLEFLDAQALYQVEQPQPAAGHRVPMRTDLTNTAVTYTHTTKTVTETNLFTGKSNSTTTDRPYDYLPVGASVPALACV
jgi:hypothetical protein